MKAEAALERRAALSPKITPAPFTRSRKRRPRARSGFKYNTRRCAAVGASRSDRRERTLRDKLAD
jgi:hypothetical protein